MINFIYHRILKPFLFMIDAEKAHDLATFFLPLIHFWMRLTQSGKKNPKLRIKLFDNDLKLPIGLAAGFDKNATFLPHLSSLGFGFAEVGTITPLPQPGNDKPRLERLIEQRALLNRMGFNNDGADIVFRRLNKIIKDLDIPVGINIGKNKNTLNENALLDYSILLEKFQTLANFFVINISSPNTKNLRDLQSEQFLESLANIITEKKIIPPTLIKLSPSISDSHFDELCRIVQKNKHAFKGLVLTNTIVTDLGGISGEPLKIIAKERLKRARAMMSDEMTLISVGGIDSAQEVLDRLRLGASAVELYTSFIYKGPAFIHQIQNDLIKLLESERIQDLNAIRNNRIQI